MKILKLAICASFMLFNSLSADLNIHTAQNRTNGDSLSVWENYTTFGYDIFASIQTAGSWSTSTVGDPNTSPFQPIAAINSSNQMAAIWQGFDTFTFTPALYGSFYSGAVWTTTQISDPSLEQLLGNYQIFISDTGTVLVTWSSYMFLTGTFEARSSYSSTYGTWGTPTTIP